MTDLQCNICNNTEFLPGPGERLSPGGILPRCSNCHSLERHRIVYTTLDTVRTDAWQTKKAIQFSEDKSISADWFGEFETSTYPGPDAIDICDINRPDNSYDFVFVNHVLEHVPDDHAAIKELIRITSDSGMLLITVPMPFHLDKTIDWGYADARQHGHYKLYGKDIINYFSRITEIPLIVITSEDPVTGERDYVFIFTKSEEMKKHILNKDWIDIYIIENNDPRTLVTENDLINYSKQLSLSPGEKQYNETHSRRFTYLVNHINLLLKSNIKILDVAGGNLTREFVNKFCQVSEYTTESNHDVEIDNWSDNYRDFDLVIFTEVIEHLNADPAYTIFQCNKCLKPGGMLILTTVNISRLFSIAELINGNTPYVMGGVFKRRQDRHHREYSPNETAQLIAANGFKVDLLTFDSYKQTSYQKAMINALDKNLIRDFSLHRDTICILGTKIDEPGEPVRQWPVYHFSVSENSPEHIQNEVLNNINVLKSNYELFSLTSSKN